MRRNLRTPLSLVVLIIAVFGIFWISKQSETEKPLETVPIVSHDHAVPELESVEVDPILMDGFQSWMTAFRAGERGETFINQGLDLAEERRSTMLELLQRDASLALTYAISYADYASLPETMQAIVEEPFSSTGDVEVIALCDHDYHTPEYRVNVYLEDQQRLRTAPNSPMRSGLSKLDVPLQGIELDGWTALKPQVFDRLEGDDVDWAWDSLPTGNPDSSVDFLTGEPLGANPITVVAGGFSFLFANEENLNSLEAELISYDNMAGEHTGSSVIFSEEVQEVQAKGFPIELIRNVQNQLSKDDTTGDKTSLFIQIVFTDKTEAPISKADLEAQINTTVSGHLADFSYNQTSMTATVTDKVYSASGESGDYDGSLNDEEDLWQEAVDAWKGDNADADPFNTYDIVGIIFPKIDTVGWAGLGTVGGANSKHWLNGVASTETIVHEFGHNYGLKHSNFWVFNKNGESTNPVEPSPIGASEEYGDLWDVMGDGDATRGHFHMAAKRFLRWLTEDQIETLDTDGSYTRQVYRFDHVDAKSDSLQGLEIKKTNGENYWVGFRRAFESNANYYRGAYILWERANNPNNPNDDENQGWIIDTTPESDGERQDAGISLGRTYSDADAQVHITPTAVVGSGAETYLDVVVNIGAFAGNNAPTISNPSIPDAGDARTALTLSLTGDDADGDDLAYFWDLGDGQVYPSAPSIEAVFPVGGSYQVTVTVSDMKGGTAQHSEPIEVADPVNNWTTRTSGVTQPLHGITDNGSIAVAVGNFTILTSEDGETWTSRDPGILNYILKDIVWTGSEFLASGLLFDGGFVNGILSSPDGITWSEEYLGSVSQSDYQSIASNEDGSLVVAVTEDGLISVRDSEGTWSHVDFGFPPLSFLGVDYGNGVFVIGGHDQVNNLLILKRTEDGKNFSDLVDNADLPEWTWLDNVAFHNGLFLASGFFANIQFSENGGLSWRSLLTGTFNVEAFAYGAGVFYSLGEDMDNGNATVNFVSSNGKNWSQVAAESIEDGNEVHFFNNSFIIVGDGGLIRQSGLLEAADEVLAAPDILPSSQNFSSTVNVTMSTDSESAEIRYTVDGSEPSIGSDLYEEAIVISETTTVKAKVFKGELDPSPTAAETYTKVLSGFDLWMASFSVDGEDGASDNPDGDWALNLLERAVGSAPDDGDSAPAAPVMSVDGSGKIVFKISRLSKSGDVALSIEKSSNLKDWTVLATTITSDTDTMLELTSDEALAFVPCFLRVKAVE